MSSDFLENKKDSIPVLKIQSVPDSLSNPSEVMQQFTKQISEIAKAIIPDQKSFFENILSFNKSLAKILKSNYTFLKVNEKYSDTLQESIEPLSRVIKTQLESLQLDAIYLASFLESFSQSLSLSWTTQTFIQRLENESVDQIFDYRSCLILLLTEKAFAHQWFPYVFFYMKNIDLIELKKIIEDEVNLESDRRCFADEKIINYFSPHELKSIKESWMDINICNDTKRMLRHAIDAHNRGHYMLTISCLSLLWEGWILEKCRTDPTTRQSKVVNRFKYLAENNGYHAIFGEFYEKLIGAQCFKSADIIEGIPCRNGIAHGIYKKYPNKKSSINAILITDFILNLEPIEE